MEARAVFWIHLWACGQSTVTTTLAAAPDAETFMNTTVMEISDAHIDVSGLQAYVSLCEDRKLGTPTKGQSPCVDHRFFVAPVRTGTEGPDDPVRAWVDCPEDDVKTAAECIAFLKGKKPHGRVLWRYGEDTSGWYRAVRDSGMVSAPKAPLILVK